MTIKILHIDTEKTWRGGENQLRLLIVGSQSSAQHFIAAHLDSEAAKRMKTAATVVPINTRTPWGMLKSAYRLAQYCRQNEISIIDCHSSRSHSLGLAVKKFNPKVKLVVHRRVDFSPSKNYWSRRKYTSGQVDQFIAISDEISRILIDYGVDSQKVTTVHSGVDPAPFRNVNARQAKEEIFSQLSISEDKILIANVAYHTEQKGMETLIQGLEILKSKCQNFVCVLAGEGHLTPKLKEMTAQAALQDHVKFLGIRHDIAEILAAADIFALPSNKEGLGTSILDALFSHCAVAASRVGGIPEMIIDQRTGLLSDVGDFHKLAENLYQLIEDPVKRRELSSEGLKHIESKFTQEAMVQGNLRTYKSLLK